MSRRRFGLVLIGVGATLCVGVALQSLRGADADGTAAALAPDRADTRFGVALPDPVRSFAGPLPMGACYLPAGCNEPVTRVDCDAMTGVYGGDDSTCCDRIEAGSQPTPPAWPYGDMTAICSSSRPLANLVPTQDLEAYMNGPLLSFLRDRDYAGPSFDWVSDRDWRLTGRYQGCPDGSGTDVGRDYGTHQAVRIYYSPEVVDWMCNDRVGNIPAGAMIIKEARGIARFGVAPQKVCAQPPPRPPLPAPPDPQIPCTTDAECPGGQCVHPMWLPLKICADSDSDTPCTTDVDCPGSTCIEPQPTQWAVMIKGDDNPTPPPGFGTISHDGWFWIGLGEEFGNPPIGDRSAVTTMFPTDFFVPEERLIDHCETRYPTGQAAPLPFRCSISGDPCDVDQDCPGAPVEVCWTDRPRRCSVSCEPCDTTADCPLGLDDCEGTCSRTGELCSSDLQCPDTGQRCVARKEGSIVYPNYQFGSYCLNCHASAVSESTYADPGNILGEQVVYGYCGTGEACCPTGEPCAGPGGPPADGIHGSQGTLPSRTFVTPLQDPDQDFLDLFPQFGPGGVLFSTVLGTRLPAQTYDHALTSPEATNTEQYLTSDQCSGCHDATRSGNLGVNMVQTLSTECTTDAECVDACAPHGGFCNNDAPTRVCEFNDFNGQLCGEQVNLSPYGEWSASPMGLAGRDPIFFAQVQTETNLTPSRKECIETYCLHCHGAMAQRQKANDSPMADACGDILDPNWGPASFEAIFDRDDLDQWPGNSDAEDAKYAGLGRDGVSCAVCHHISGDGLSTAQNSPNGAVYVGVEPGKMTANFSPDAADTINGPYPDPLRRPMQNALGITPRGAPQIEQAGLCGTCHVLRVPVLKNLVELGPTPVIALACMDGPDRIGSGLDAIAECATKLESDPCTVGPETGACQNYFTFEQTTYLEFLNSDFNQSGTTCQDCHMPNTFHEDDEGEELAFKIANIEDEESFPQVHQRLPGSEINLPERGGCTDPDCAGGGQKYARHTLYGLNIFLNEMVQQFPLLVGVRQIDYLNGTAVPALITARDSVLDQARNSTAEIALDSVVLDRDGPIDVLNVDVTVTNLTGHKLPSGVGFRRAFIELLVCETEGCTCESGSLWGSGCTDSLGVIVNGTGQRLASEFSCPVGGPQTATCPPPGPDLGCPETHGPDDQCYQPHFGSTTLHGAIEREDQVQIYQLLETDCDGRFTSSVTHLCDDVKDNRLLPKGWQANGPFAGSTKPGPLADQDPDYQSGGPPGVTGADTVTYRIDLVDPTWADRIHSVRATLHSQSIPPSFLNDRFNDAFLGAGLKDDTERLYHMASRLDVGAPTDDTGQPFIENWKLELVSDSGVATPAGVVPPTVTVDRFGADQLRIRWSASTCSSVDYGIYRGSLASLSDPSPAYDHVAVSCTDAPPLFEEDVSVPVDDSYYLVVPRTEFVEGSYGANSLLVERPVGTGTTVCREAQDLTVCP